MSYDVIALKYDRKVGVGSSIDETHEIPLGKSSDIRRIIEDWNPSFEWHDESYGTAEFDGSTVEITLGGGHIIKQLFISVHVNDFAIPQLITLANNNGWLLMDCSGGELINQPLM